MQKKYGSSISVTARSYLYCICIIERDNWFQKYSERPALQRNHSIFPRFQITTFWVSRTSCSTCSCMKHIGFYSKSLPNSINQFLLEQPSVKIGMKKIMMMRNFRYCNLLQDHRHLMIVSVGQWIRRPVNVREISAEEPMLSPNKDYHHKYCTFLNNFSYTN